MREVEALVRVVGAVALARDGRVYVSQRPPGGRHGGLWEFPGGKVEEREDDRSALRREIREELQVDSKVGGHVATGEDQQISLHCYQVDLADEPSPRPPRVGQWADASSLRALHMPPADEPARQWVLRELAE